MNLQPEQLKFCVDLAKELSDYYDCDALAKSDRKCMNEIISFFGKFLGKEVVIRDLELRTNRETNFRGLTLPHKDGHYEIYILLEEDENTRRFVTCKEMFQVIIDSQNSSMRSMDIYEHITALMLQDMQAPTKAVMAELMAEVAAMQFLYPYSERVADLKLIENKDKSYEEIAEHYGIPQIYIERYLTNKIMDALKGSHLVRSVAAE